MDPDGRRSIENHLSDRIPFGATGVRPSAPPPAPRDRAGTSRRRLDPPCGPTVRLPAAPPSCKNDARNKTGAEEPRTTMTADDEKTSILIVDDLPETILAYTTVLE